MGGFRDLAEFKTEFEERVLDAFEALPLVERLRFVSALLFNCGGSVEDEDADPMLKLAVLMIDSAVEELSVEPVRGRAPRAPEGTAAGPR